MKSNLISIIVAAVLVCGLVASHYSEEEQEPVLTSFKSASLSNKRYTSFEVDYMDAVMTLKELKNDSDLIINGKLLSQREYGEFSILSTVKVIAQRKGNVESRTIDILQVGTPGMGTILVPNKSYLLFLGKQLDAEDNIYFIKGGQQGIGEIVKNNELFFYDRTLQQDFESHYQKTTAKKTLSAFNKWLGQN
ncbi:hypothetical protein [Paenibacillus glycanilyticus]|uniref:Uncharacterized protein n=1 Tax=Paenibacillus glycanilyticus TaxID=126569 RepID=A0ABQ6GKA9_9BACL|nr:hypothetical protein [Paenibacillus glycanilyticus]GLX71371.1 hypothetical protein MU1_57210 [Paenibacillus glycanilyticus]